MKNKLKIGVLINSSKVPSWAHKMLKDIHDSEYAEICMFIQDEVKALSGFKKTIKNIFNQKLFYSIFYKIEAKCFKLKNNAFLLKDINSFDSIPILIASYDKTNISFQFSSETIKAIREYNLDVIIRLGFPTLNSDILKSAKFGIWSYDFLDDQIERRVHAGFWEVLNKTGITKLSLRITSSITSGSEELYQSFSITDRISVTRTMNMYVWKAAKFVPRKLEELYHKGEEKFLDNLRTKNNNPTFYFENNHDIPNNIKMVFLFIRYLINIFSYKINRFLFVNQWHLEYSFKNNNRISKTLFEFKKIIPPKDRFWADPHFVKKDGKYYIFVEEYIYKKEKAHISFMELDDSGNYSDPHIIIDQAYHMSYPSVFEANGKFYMIPETSSNKNIELYECTEFPSKWKLLKVLFSNIVAVDTTVFYHNKKWWLFTNIVENQGGSSYDELFLFSSDELVTSSWIPHPQNPIISDVRSSRSAGKIFCIDDVFYRPSQNCSGIYGYGIKINQIEILNELQYKEKIISEILPMWGKNYVQTHTLNYKEDFTIIDVSEKKLRSIF